MKVAHRRSRRKRFTAVLALVALFLALSFAAAGWLLSVIWDSGDLTSPGVEGGGKSARQAGQPAPYHGELPSLAGVNIRDVVLEQVVGGLEDPWAMEFLPGEELLISEFPGRLQRLRLPDRRLEEIRGLPPIPAGPGQLGLMDLALHPAFAENGLIFFSHAVRGEKGGKGEGELYAMAVSRARLEGNALVDLQQIFLAEPFTRSNSNLGGALEFDGQGNLLVGSGDRSVNHRAQDPRHLHGKIIRIDIQGRAPADNPFVADGRTDDRIYALGVRNTQGLVLDGATGKLYETEHGPMGGDEVNVIEAGRNYGWPMITYGANYTTEKIGVGTALPGLEQPLFYYLPSIAISPVTIYRGAMFPEWEGDLLVGALKGAHVSKLDIVDGRVISAQTILDEAGGRIRDLKVAADGSIYILVQNGGKLLRLHRDPDREGLESPGQRRGVTVYQQVCRSCHSSGQRLIPQIGDRAAWAERLPKGRELLYQHTLEGFNGMPPRGLCDSCTDEEIGAAVDYMIQRVAKKP
jgi:glucose/arabinose dehydrogenase/cytochrome c5